MKLSDLQGRYQVVSQPPVPAAASPEPQRDALDTAQSIASTVFPGEKIGQAIGALGGYGLAALQERLGIVPRGTAAQFDLSGISPLQTVGDAAKAGAAVGGLRVGAPATIKGAAALGAGLGAVGGAGEAATRTSGEALPTAQDVKDTAAGGLVGGLVGAGVSAGVTGLSKLFTNTGTKITDSVIKPTQADIKDGFSVETVKKYDLGGNLPTMLDKTEAKMGELTKQLNAKLAETDAVIDLNQVYKETIEGLTDKKTVNFGSNTSMENALAQLKAEVDQIAGPDGSVSIPDAQIVKRSAGKMGAWQFGAVDPDSTARERVYNAFYSRMKTAIENNSPEGVREINKQLSELIPVENAIIRRIPIAQRNNLLSLGDLVSLSAAAINPNALAITMLSLMSKSGTAGNLLMKYGPNLAPAAAPLGSLIGTEAANGAAE